MSNRQVLGVLVIVALSTSVLSLLQNPAGWTPEWRTGWLQNFSTEMMGAIVTFWLFELIVGERKQRELEEKRQQSARERFIRELGSQVHATAINAVRELRSNGWLQDGSLKKADLRRANLKEAKLSSIDIEAADLSSANLQGADLRQAKLQGVNFAGANLQGALLEESRMDRKTILPNKTLWSPQVELAMFTDQNHPQFWQGYGLEGRDLRKTDLQDANLEGADLSYARLQGANLRGANLRYAVLDEVQFDENTVLPCAVFWTPDFDLNCLIDPNHPRFWRGYALAGCDLSRKDFQNINLEGANLLGCDLSQCNLQGANLRGANLGKTNLEKANLWGADLRESSLRRAILKNADMWAVNLEDADMRRAILSGAKLEAARMNNNTILPNGERWELNTNMRQFTRVKAMHSE